MNMKLQKNFKFSFLTDACKLLPYLPLISEEILSQKKNTRDEEIITSRPTGTI